MSSRIIRIQLLTLLCRILVRAWAVLCQRTCSSDTWRWQSFRWCHAAALGKKKTTIAYLHGTSQFLTSTVCRFTPRRHARRPTIAGVAADKVTKRQVNQNSNTVNCQVPTVIFVPVATGSAGTTCLIPGRRISDVTEDRHKRSRTDGCEWPVLLWFLARHNVVK